MTVKAIVLTGFGINCDQETHQAFVRAGAQTECVHLSDLLNKPALLDNAHIFAVPGGFSYGDHVASGKILANRLRHQLEAPLKKFIDDGKLVLGICNGFQVLVKMGLLPFFDGKVGQEVSLTTNESGRFENRWVHLAVPENNNCVWLKGLTRLELPVRQGEGKFIARNEEVLKRLSEEGFVALRYIRPNGSPAAGEFPFNPSGAQDDVAALCDPSGRIFGLMPHPEAYLHGQNHPEWTRLGFTEEGTGLILFKNAVDYVRTSFC
ncbi:MAG: phosphoribosylformylglycinamidine synthase subunit PurQ [Candidatus Hydrogenedens sp.]|nr:phosphoribosylformylglycinamidine synthase subunit PurQ [Candidatus Hydrogenedens sp.]